MLQFLVGDHLQGYGLPCLRSKMGFACEILYINEKSIVRGNRRDCYLCSARPIALRVFWGSLRVLLEDGTERLFNNPMVGIRLKVIPFSHMTFYLES